MDHPHLTFIQPLHTSNTSIVLPPTIPPFFTPLFLLVEQYWSIRSQSYTHQKDTPQIRPSTSQLPAWVWSNCYSWWLVYLWDIVRKNCCFCYLFVHEKVTNRTRQKVPIKVARRWRKDQGCFRTGNFTGHFNGRHPIQWNHFNPFQWNQKWPSLMWRLRYGNNQSTLLLILKN